MLKSLPVPKEETFFFHHLCMLNHKVKLLSSYLFYTISFDNWLCKLNNLMLSVLLLPFLEDILIIINNSIAFTMQTFVS